LFIAEDALLSRNYQVTLQRAKSLRKEEKYFGWNLKKRRKPQYFAKS
jgi:hypothetical protein